MNQSSQEQPVVQASKGNNGGLKVLTAIMSILAIGGVGFGVYGMTKNTTNNKAQSDFKVEVVDEDGQKSTIESEKITVADDGKTITISDTATPVKNPVLQDEDDIELSSIADAVATASNDGQLYKVTLKVANGEISSCNLFKSEADGNFRYVRDCDGPTGFSGKISQILDMGEGQSFFPYTGFIMEDGSVQYVKNEDLINYVIGGVVVPVQGALKIDGKVTTATHVHVYPKNLEGIGAYVTTMFYLSDGTYVKFNDSMLN